MDEKMQKALANGMKDTMWAMFWKGNQKADLESLEESVQRLIRMATQKNAGQRGDVTCIDWNTLDMELMRIVMEATALVLDERFDKLKEEWRE
jgi:hypothetical protein